MSFQTVTDFEKEISKFYGAPYGIAIDSCTHAIELCLRYKKVEKFTVPPNTYPSIPNLAKKIGIEFEWEEQDWKDYYYLGGTNIIDSAVLWKENSYIPNTFMCLSFQFQKHLNDQYGLKLFYHRKLDLIRRFLAQNAGFHSHSAVRRPCRI